MLKVCFKQSRAVPKIAMYDLRVWCLPSLDYVDGDFLFYSFVAAKGGKISFREYIDFWCFSNKEAIFELIARNESIPTATDATDTREQERDDGLGPPQVITDHKTQEPNTSTQTDSRLKEASDSQAQALDVAPQARSGPNQEPGESILGTPDVLGSAREKPYVAWVQHMLESRVSVFILGKSTFPLSFVLHWTRAVSNRHINRRAVGVGTFPASGDACLGTGGGLSWDRVGDTRTNRSLDSEKTKTE
jgi:hypothetical protein